MSTISHPPTGVVPEKQSWSVRLLVKEMWATIGIVAMWVVVAVSAVWGPDFVGSSNDGNSSTIPSAIIIALFASIGTWALAKYGFRDRPKEDN